MKRRLVYPLALAVTSCLLQAQPLEVRLETCNAIKNSKQRLDCLKAVTAAPAPSGTTTPTADPKAPAPNQLDVSGAATICEKLLTGFQSKHDLATEDKAKSTELELAVTWPPNEGRPPSTCMVSRATRKVVAIEGNGKQLSGAVLEELERDAGFREEAQSGKYDGFLRFAKDSLTRSFKDPSSVQYRGLFISGKPMLVLCGEVNGKNSYGAYVGFRRFYATGKPMLDSIESPSERYVFERMWPSMCGNKQIDIDQ